MAAIMELDTSLWLHNKLGNDDNLWSTGGIASQFTKTVLQNTYDIFVQLDTRMKIKTLLSFLEIPLRNMQEFQHLLMQIINVAEMDNDDWVKVAANIVKDYPQHPVIDKRLGHVTSSFQETFNEVINEVVDVDKSKLSYMLPLECKYLNETALSHIVPDTAAPPKHFTLRRIPKSAALRAKITQKANDAVNQRRLSHSLSNTPSSGKANLKRVNSNSVPVPHSKIGLTKVSSLPKKTKLLDIADQPLGMREQKKRKKILAMEAQLEEAKQKKQAKEQKKHHEDSTDEKTDTANETTDTGSGTENEDVMEPAAMQHEDSTDTTATDTSAINTPSYAVLPTSTSSIKDTPLSSQPLEQPQYPLSSQPVEQPQYPYISPNPPHANLNNQLRGGEISTLVNVDPSASLATQHFQRELQMRVQQEHELRMQQEQQQLRYNQQLFQQQQMQSYQQQQGMLPPAMGDMSRGMSNQLPPSMSIPGAAQQMPNQRKKGLSLTREKMLAAQEMFKSANCVKRPEKALILGFMAGARENPFPQQGPVITIKLSEHTEMIPPTPQADGSTTPPQTMIIEMLFEMNYDTGLWKRLKRTRVVSQQPTN